MFFHRSALRRTAAVLCAALLSTSASAAETARNKARSPVFAPTLPLLRGKSRTIFKKTGIFSKKPFPIARFMVY